MSIYTLLISDTARSGCRMDLLAPVYYMDDDHIPLHPFVWTEMCPRPELECIPADLEQDLIEAAVQAGNSIHNLKAGTMGMVFAPHEKYLSLIVKAQYCVDNYKGRYDFADTLTQHLSKFRTEVLYNMGMAMFHEALAHGWLDSRHGHAVGKLAETAAFFDMILTAPYRVPSQRPELGPDSLRAMALLALGTAKEIEVAYQIKDAGCNLDGVAETCHQACHFYRVLTVVAELLSSHPDFTSLINFAQIKRCYYEGMACFLMSADPDTKKGKSRRRKAQECFEFAFGYANLHMPGERRQVEQELQTTIEQCINFRALVRKSMIPFAVISSRKNRFAMSDEQFGCTEKKAKLSYDLSQRFQRIGELSEERAKGITAKPKFVSEEERYKSQLCDSIGALVKETTPKHEADSLVDIVLRTQHVNLLQRIAAVDAQKEEMKAEQAAGGDPTASVKSLANAQKNAAALAPYYYVQSLIKVQCVPEPAELHLTHNTAFVFIVDVTGVERPSAASVKELVSLAVRTSFIGEGDRIGCVVPQDGEDQFQVDLVPADEAGKKTFAERVGQPTRLRSPAFQPSLVGAVVAARQALEALPRHFYKHIFILSDFGQRTMSSYAGNWDMLNKLRAPGQMLGPQDPAKLSTGSSTAPESVRIHSFGVAGDATSHLLRLMSANSKGDHGYWLRHPTDLTKDNDNFGQMRSWLVNLLTMTKRTFARDVVVQVTSVADSRIYSVSSAYSKDVDILNPKPALFKDLSASIPDLAHTFSGEVLAVCAIPPEACRQDVVQLGYAELRYTRGDGSVRRLKLMLLNESNNSLIDRESFRWMQQLRLEGCEGGVSMKYDGGTFREVKSRGVETLTVRDSVVVHKGNVSLSSIEGVTVEAGPNAEFTVDYIGTSEFTLNVLLGDFKINTTSFGTCTLSIADEYVVKVPENSMARVDFCELSEGWTLTVKSIIGNVFIHTLSLGAGSEAMLTKNASGVVAAVATAAAAGSGSNALVRELTTTAYNSGSDGQAGALASPAVLELQAPRVTACRLGEGPMTPWVGIEDGFSGWKPLAYRVAERVLALADIDMYHCRSACLPVMQDVNRWMQRRNRTGTIIPNTGARRCRKFLIWNRISGVRQRLANSSSQAIGGEEFAAIKRQLDVATAFSSPMKYDQISWEAVRNVTDAYRALETLRPAGSTSAFAPKDFADQVTVLMSTREREAAERERMMREKEREIKNAEVRRRKELVAAHFPLWDFEGDNEVSVADVQMVFYDMPCRETPVIVRVFERWDRLISATTTKRSFNVEQLVTILYTFSQDVDALDFNKFFEQVGNAVRNISTLVDQSRVHRALFALFRWFDHDDKKGWVTIRRIASVVHAVMGDDAVVFRRIEKITQAAIAALNTKLPKNFPPPPDKRSTPLNSRTVSRSNTTTPSGHASSSARRPSASASVGSSAGVPVAAPTPVEAPPVTLETLDSQRITLSTFIHAMLAFFDGLDEPSTHREIESLFNYLFQKAKLPQDATYVINLEKKNAERQRLLDWDLPHAFDGVRDKDLAKVLDPEWTPPANVNELCRAPCLILGLTKIKFNQVHRDDVKGVAEEYWKTIRKLLRTDSDSVFRYFKNFPPLSLSNRQIKVLGPSLESKDFDSTQLTKISPLFSALCSWTRVILRIGWLVHEWEKPRLISDAELSKTMTHQLEMLQVQQARAAAEAMGVNKHNSVVLEAQRKYNQEFQGVYQAPDPTGARSSGFTSTPSTTAGGAAYTPARPGGDKPPVAPRRPSSTTGASTTSTVTAKKEAVQDEEL